MRRAKIVAVIDDEACVEMRDQDGIDQREEQDHHEHEITGRPGLALTNGHARILAARQILQEMPTFNFDTSSFIGVT
jgi:hypothetical protein